MLAHSSRMDLSILGDETGLLTPARPCGQGVLAGELEQGGRCTWLIGTPALRFAGEVDETAYHREVQIDGLGLLWALPGLELLIDEPARKGELWKAMRRVMPRWLSQPE